MVKINFSRKFYLLFPILFFLPISCVKVFNFDKGGGGGSSFSPALPTPTAKNLTFYEFSKVYPTESLILTSNLSYKLPILVSSIEQDSNGNIYTISQLQLDGVGLNSQPGDYSFDSVATSLGAGNGSSVDSYLVQYDIKGTVLNKKSLLLPKQNLNLSNLPAVYLNQLYMKPTALTYDSIGNLLLYGSKSDNGAPSAVLPSFDNFFLSKLDSSGNLTNLYTDISSTAGNVSVQTKLVPSAGGTSYMLASVDNIHTNFTSILNNLTNFKVQAFSTPTTPSPLGDISSLLGVGKWYVASANVVDSKGDLYLATPSSLSPSEINVYKYNIKTSTLSAAQVFDIVGSLPALTTFNPNSTTFFQIYVDASDNAYLYGTIPLGTQAPTSFPPAVPSDKSIGFIAKLNTSVAPTLNITFIYDNSDLTNYPIATQLVRVNDLASDSSGNIYALGDFTNGASPALFSSSGLVGYTSGYIAKYSAHSIGSSPTAQPISHSFINYNKLEIVPQSLKIFDADKLYVAGTMLYLGGDGLNTTNVLGAYTVGGSDPYYFFTTVVLK